MFSNIPLLIAEYANPSVYASLEKVLEAEG
jgi:hypothetical protein